MIVTGIVAVLLFGWIFKSRVSRILEQKSCREQVTGVCKKLVKRATIRHTIYYKAEFHYTYGNKQYESCAMEELGGKEKEQFQPGKTYSLYINPRNPLHIRCTQKNAAFQDLFGVVLYGFLFLVGVLGLIGQLAG